MTAQSIGEGTWFLKVAKEKAFHHGQKACMKRVTTVRIPLGCTSSRMYFIEVDHAFPPSPCYSLSAKLCMEESSYERKYNQTAAERNPC